MQHGGWADVSTPGPRLDDLWRPTESCNIWATDPWVPWRSGVVGFEQQKKAARRYVLHAGLYCSHVQSISTTGRRALVCVRCKVKASGWSEVGRAVCGAASTPTSYCTSVSVHNSGVSCTTQRADDDLAQVKRLSAINLRLGWSNSDPVADGSPNARTRDCARLCPTPFLTPAAISHLAGGHVWPVQVGGFFGPY